MTERAVQLVFMFTTALITAYLLVSLHSIKKEIFQLTKTIERLEARSPSL